MHVGLIHWTLEGLKTLFTSSVHTFKHCFYSRYDNVHTLELSHRIIYMSHKLTYSHADRHTHTFECIMAKIRALLHLIPAEGLPIFPVVL